MDGIEVETGKKRINKYERLRAFAIMLVTDDEDLFCRCYSFITNKNIDVGHYVWKRTQDYYLNEINKRNLFYKKRKKARQEALNKGSNQTELGL